jgi:hypothetical protein
VLNDEGVYNAVITCSDNRGGTTFGEITIECIQHRSKTSYHETQIPPTIYLDAPSTEGLLGPTKSTYDPLGYPNIYPLNGLNPINPIPVPFSHTGFANTQGLTPLGDMGAAYGIGFFPELMPWWAY